MNEITRQCLSLDRAKREKLVKVLQESLEKQDNFSEDRFRIIYNAASEIFGQGILTCSREFGLVLARRFIVWQMREEGYSYPTIGRYLVRHHASAIHMYKMMEDVFNYPETFKLEMAYWTQFQNKLKEYETN